MVIYNTDDTELLNAIITEGAEHEEELMKSDFIKFSFNADVRMTLPVGAYIVFNGLKYRLSEPYQPSQESEIEFKYEPLFHHPKMWLGKVIFVFDTTDTTGKPIKQQVWDYNGFTGTLLQYVVDAINEAFGFAEEDKFNYTVIGEVDNTVSVSFSNTDILSAISAIASACKDNQCEWHLDWTDKSLYFGQLAYNRGEETPILKVGENVGKASVSTSNDGYYNVFRPEGSTRNMSIKAASGENVSTGVRLILNETDYPDGKIYVSPSGNIITKASFEASGVPAQTLGLTFDDVYPHVDLYAYNIRKRTRYLLDDSGKKVVDHYDGDTPIYKTYTVWYMRLAYPTIVGGSVTGWTDYTLDVDKQVLDGYKPMVTFKANTSEGALSSSLAGQPTSGDGFEIVYHKTSISIPASETTGDSGVEVLAGDYEIVFVKQGENDMIVPTNEDAGLIPRGEATPSMKGNIVVLYNIAMGANEVLAAQQELLDKTKKEIARRFSDLNNYTVQSYPHVFEKANPNLYIGQRVVFNNGDYQLTTRVTKLVTKLDYNFIQTVTVGNQQIKGSISQLKEDVKTIMSGNFSGAGINQTQALNLIKNYVGSRYLSKLSADTAQGLITFLQGLTSKELATFQKLIIAQGGIQLGDTFVPGLVGKGGKIDGEGRGEMRSLRLWESLEVPEIRYNRVSVYTGIRWDTFGGGIIETVTPDSTGAETGTCTLKLEDGEYGAIGVGDLCMGIWHDTTGNSTESKDDNKGNFLFKGFKTVYFQITGVSGENNGTFTYMLRSSADGGNGIHPFPFMHFAGRGNIENEERQSFTYTTTEYTVSLTGVKTWEFQAENYYSLHGHIEGFSMPAVDSNGNKYTMTFHGYGNVMGNAYIFGNIDRFERVGYRMFIDQSLNGSMSPTDKDGETVTCTILDGYNHDCTSQFTLYSVTRNSGDSASDAIWNQSHTNVGNPFKIAYSDLGIDGIHRLLVTFTVTATDEATDAKAAKSIDFQS